MFWGIYTPRGNKEGKTENGEWPAKRQWAQYRQGQSNPVKPSQAESSLVKLGTRLGMAHSWWPASRLGSVLWRAKRAKIKVESNHYQGRIKPNQSKSG
jgi:hypothetical protein